jgi:hypothetical protein
MTQAEKIVELNQNGFEASLVNGAILVTIADSEEYTAPTPEELAIINKDYDYSSFFAE